MNKTGWLVNDTLTCIPGTKTFWHCLLEWIPNLIDKTNGYTPYNILASEIEKQAQQQSPNYIIRNASYFRSMDINCKTISFLQDINANRNLQIDVCNKSDFIVCNSSYTASKYTELDANKIKIIPIGIDFDFFKPEKINNDLGILENSILFIGDNTIYPKGFDLLTEIINKTKYNFCLVMKNDFKLENNRVKVFNKINHDFLLKIYNSCKMLICTSLEETQHLSGIEAGACNLPILSTNVGVYYNLKGSWGLTCKTLDDFVQGIEYIRNNGNSFSPRSFWLSTKSVDLNSCKQNWINLIEEL